MLIHDNYSVFITCFKPHLPQKRSSTGILDEHFAQYLINNGGGAVTTSLLMLTTINLLSFFWTVSFRNFRLLSGLYSGYSRFKRGIGSKARFLLEGRRSTSRRCESDCVHSKQLHGLCGEGASYSIVGVFIMFVRYCKDLP